MKILYSYLKHSRSTLIWILIYLLLLTLAFFLYNLPLEPVLYVAALSLVICLVYLGHDYVKYRNKHLQLQTSLKLSEYDLSTLPEPQDLLEKDYQEIIAKLDMDRKLQEAAFENTRQQMVDYYTLWVHQIKTPISAVRLLLQGEDNELTAELGLELFKIESYVEMVLHYLRIESPSSDFVIKRYNLEDIVKQAVRRYARMFIRKKLNLQLGPLDCEVLTDEKWLVFVIEQVISNAIKYTNSGTISIYLDSTRPKTLVIEDTGIGIAPEDLPRVFDPGYTGYIGRLDKRATGVGLYLCKKILTKLSHTIEIESVVEQGTKVLIGLDTAETIIE